MLRSIAVLGDIHGAYRGVARVAGHLAAAPPDLVVLVGDLGSDLLWHPTDEPPEKVRRWQTSIDWILDALEGLKVPVVLVPGNHDRSDPAVREGVVNLDGRSLELHGWKLCGVGGAGPAFFGLPYEWTEQELDAHLERRGWRDIRPDILVCHTPPRDTGLDRLTNGESTGSTTLARWVEAVQPALYLCGHIHEAVGHRMLGTTLAVNAGRLIWAPYDRFGRPRKGSLSSFQFYRIELEGRSPQRLERFRLACKGPPRVLEHTAWLAADGFTIDHEI